MQDYNKEPTELDQALAIIQICKDLLEHKKRDIKLLFIALIISLVMNLAIVGAFLWYESGWDYTDTTTTTVEQSVDGDDGSIVNGDQYNDQDMDDPKAIPESWYRYTRQEVDTGTKKSSVKAGIEKWVKWEKKTKQLYQEMYQELMNIGEVAAAKFISCYVCDVDCELKHAERKHLDLEAVSYDLGAVVSEQHELHEKYHCMLEHLDLSM